MAESVAQAWRSAAANPLLASAQLPQRLFDKQQQTALAEPGYFASASDTRGQ